MIFWLTKLSRAFLACLPQQFQRRFFSLPQCVATASGDATVKLWAVADFSCIKTFEGHTNSVLKVIFLTRGMQIASWYLWPFL